MTASRARSTATATKAEEKTAGAAAAGAEEEATGVAEASPAPSARGDVAAAAAAAAEAEATGAKTYPSALSEIPFSEYEQQLGHKVERVRGLLEACGAPAPVVYRSEPAGYRMRCELAVRHEGDEMHYEMFEKAPGQGRGRGERRPVRVDRLPIANNIIKALMPRVLEGVRGSKELRTRLFQVNFHTTLSGQAMVGLVYHRKLDEAAWKREAEGLREFLAATPVPGGVCPSFAPADPLVADGSAPLPLPAPPVELELSLIGRSRGQKFVLGSDSVVEVLDVAGKTLRYRQAEGAFSQPNARVATSMLEWALGVARSAAARGDRASVPPASDGADSAAREAGDEAPAPARAPAGEGAPNPAAPPAAAPSGGRDLLELYCGNGNFTAALAPAYRRVVATELSKPGVAAARENLEANGISNTFVARMSSEEFVEAWRDGRPRERLRDLDLAACDFGTLFVDPPRAGLDPGTVRLASEFDAVIYVSCNPETLRDNVRSLSDTFEIADLALFDQFPWTHHVEVGAYLRRRDGLAPGAAGRKETPAPTSADLPADPAADAGVPAGPGGDAAPTSRKRKANAAGSPPSPPEPASGGAADAA